MRFIVEMTWCVREAASKNSAVALPPDNVLKRAEAIISSVLDVDSCERRRQATILEVEVEVRSEHNTTHMRPKDNKDGRRDLDLDMKHILLCVR